MEHCERLPDYLPVGPCDASLMRACRSSGLSAIVPETITSYERFEDVKRIGRRPDLIVTWGFFSFWELVRDWAVKERIPVVHGEKGWFPHYRTFGFDPGGFCWQSLLCQTPYIDDPEKEYPEAKRIRRDFRGNAEAGDLPAGVRSPYVLFAGQLVTDRVNQFGLRLRGFEDHIRHLRSILPEDVQLVVRPHPRGYRNPHNQSAMERLEDVAYGLPNTLMTGEGEIAVMIEGSDGVVSINSTVLYEARLVFDKPSWAYGSSWYSGHERLIGRISPQDERLPDLDVSSDYSNRYRNWFLNELARRQILIKTAKHNRKKLARRLFEWAAVPGEAIPPIVHFIWISESTVPSRYQRNLEEFKSLNPEIGVKIHRGLPREMPEGLKALYRRIADPELSVILLRVWLLFEYGGLSFDLRYLWIRSMPRKLFLSGAWCVSSSKGNANGDALGSPRYGAAMKFCMANMLERCDEGGGFSEACFDSTVYKQMLAEDISIRKFPYWYFSVYRSRTSTFRLTNMSVRERRKDVRRVHHRCDDGVLPIAQYIKEDNVLCGKAATGVHL